MEVILESELASADEASVEATSPGEDRLPPGPNRARWRSRVGRPPRRGHYPCLHGAAPQLESLPDLLLLLPANYNYHVCSYRALPEGFVATVRVNFDSEASAQAWLAAFQETSLTTFRTRRTFPRPGPRLLCKTWYRCQRNVLSGGASSPGGRHTACPATLAVSVAAGSRRADPHLPHSPGLVEIKHVHNHPVRCEADLRFRDMSAQTRAALLALFARGHQPAAARRALRHQLQLQLGERYPLAAADRAVLPSASDVGRLYYHTYGRPTQRHTAPPPPPSAGDDEDGDEPDEVPSVENVLARRGITVGAMAEAAAPQPALAEQRRLQRLVSEYNAAMATAGAAAFRRCGGGGQFAAALTTPLMRRIHAGLPQAGELVFVDGAGRANRHGCCVWLMVCNTEAGALPLGLLMASSDAPTLLRAALDCWRRTLPADAFFGRGDTGPQVVITDDCPGQRAALAARYPAAMTVLCSFRLLQAVWRWLWEARGRVSRDDSGRLLLLARLLVQSGSVVELERRYQQARGDPTMARHPDFLKQFTSIYEHRHLWAVWYIEDDGSGGAAQPRHQDSFFAIAAKILCDRLVFMLVDYGPADAFDFFTRHADRYYVARVEARLAGVAPLASLPRYIPPPPGERLRVQRVSPHEHDVTHEGAVHRVHLALGCCMCRDGRAAGLCVHQSAVLAHERRPPPTPLPAAAAARLRHLVAELARFDSSPPLVSGDWLDAVTAAAGLRPVEVIVSEVTVPVDADLALRGNAGVRTRVSAVVADDGALHQTTDEQRVLCDQETGECLAVDESGEVCDHRVVSEPGDVCEQQVAGDQLEIHGDASRSHLDLTERLLAVESEVDSYQVIFDTDRVLRGTAGRPDGGSAAAEDDDPEEVAMSSVICDLQAVTADLTGRLAADPHKYIPLVRDLVSTYWAATGDGETLSTMSQMLTERLGTSSE